MGKGSRNKEQKAAQRQAEKEMLAKKKEQKKKARKLTAKISAIVAAAVAVVLVVAIVIGAVADSGFSMRNTTVIETDNTKVDAAMASYYMYTLYSNFKTNNSAYIDSMLDVGKSLKKQECYYDKEASWFEYFAELTSEQIVSYVALAEMSIKEGKELSEENKKLAEDAIAAIDTYAKNSGMSVSAYIKKNYGRGVKKSDIKKALELYYLASQKYTEIYDSKEVSLEDMNKFVEENKSSYYKASYYEFTIEADYDAKVADQAAVNAAIKAASDKANALAACKTEGDFEAYIKKYCKDELKQSEENANKSVTSAKQSDVSYKDSSDMQKWIFSSDRNAGETKVFEGTEKYTVIYIIEPTHKNETESKNFKHILLSLDNFESTAAVKAKADEIAKLFEAEPTAEKFDALAKEFSEDSIIDYENILQGELDTKIDTWLYDSQRKIGDVTVIENGKLVHVIYYTGEGLISWQQSAMDSIRKNYCDSVTEEAEKELAKKVAEKAFDKISI